VLIAINKSPTLQSDRLKLFAIDIALSIAKYEPMINSIKPIKIKNILLKILNPLSINSSSSKRDIFSSNVDSIYIKIIKIKNIDSPKPIFASKIITTNIEVTKNNQDISFIEVLSNGFSFDIKIIIGIKTAKLKILLPIKFEIAIDDLPCKFAIILFTISGIELPKAIKKAPIKNFEKLNLIEINSLFITIKFAPPITAQIDSIYITKSTIKPLLSLYSYN
jgi:hypothetical protein